MGFLRIPRGSWHPYFMDVNAIIFLAQISAFDERLDGVGSGTRLEDSMRLWMTICRSKLLIKVEFFLFLNKCDILERKLARGVSFSQYIPTYGDHPNDMPTAARFASLPSGSLLAAWGNMDDLLIPRARAHTELRKQFLEIACKHSPEPHRVYTFLVTAIDTRTMAALLGTIHSSIIHDNLRAAVIQ